MSWIWHRYSKDRKFYTGKNFAPYDEMLTPYNNENEAYVNVLLRFSDIFNVEILENLDNETFNIIIHFLAQLDQLKGLCREDIEEDIISLEIMNGRYGERIKELFISMNDNDQIKILRYIRKRKNGVHSGTEFGDVFTDMFYSGEQVVYFEQSTETTYCYCGKTDSEYNRKKFELIKLLFADISSKTEALWGNCLTVIGEERKHMYSAAVIDEMGII